MRARILSPPFSIHFFAFSSDDDDDDDFRSSSFPNSVSVSAVVWKVLSAFYSLPPFQLFSPFWLPVSCQCTASLLFSFYFSGVSVRLHCTAVCLCVLYSSVRRPSQCQSVSDMRSLAYAIVSQILSFQLSFFYCLDHSAIVHCRRRSFAGQTLLPAYDDFDYHGKSAHMLFLPFSLFFWR